MNQAGNVRDAARVFGEKSGEAFDDAQERPQETPETDPLDAPDAEQVDPDIHTEELSREGRDDEEDLEENRRESPDGLDDEPRHHMAP